VIGLEAAIFDLDGLLIDSEPLWHEAEVAILGPLGVPVAAMGTRQTKGMVVGEVTRYWFERFPWAGPGPDEVARLIDDEVRDLVAARAELRPGALRAIAECRSRDLSLALGSSSRYRYLETVLRRLALSESFDVVHSAQDEAYGKPHPAVFLGAAARLGVDPTACVVWEDSSAGVLAAKAARMRCIAVPDPEDRLHPAMALADVLLVSLDELDEAVWRRLDAVAG
jgi:mannitol-1-/sugar-/sorbitol-6-/2-deoxyglucose-6-phosphatase